MQGYEVLEIVFETANKLTEEGIDWNGDVWDFVSASVEVCNQLSSADVQRLHKEMRGTSFLTGESEIFFYNSEGRPQITILPTTSTGV